MLIGLIAFVVYTATELNKVKKDIAELQVEKVISYKLPVLNDNQEIIGIDATTTSERLDDIFLNILLSQ